MMKRLLLIAALLVFGATPVIAVDKDAKAKPAAEKKTGQKAEALIDINSAKTEELTTLEGIGDARAQAIIKGRPYHGKNEIVDKKIVPQAVYDKIKDRIVARQPAAKK